MGNLNWVFDAVAGLLLVGFIIQGIRKGFSRIAVPFIVNLVFVAVAFFTSGLLAGAFYDSIVEDAVETAVEESVDKFDLRGAFVKEYYNITLIENASDREIENVLASEKDMDKKMWKLIDKNSGVGDSVTESDCFTALNNIIKIYLQDSISEKIPPCSGKFFEKLDESDKEETFKILNMIYSDRKSAADYIAATCIHDVIFSFAKMMSFVIISAVLLILTSIIFSVAYRDKGDSAEGGGDSAAGAAVEILNGIMIIAVIAVLVKIMVYTGLNIEGIMDDRTLNSSYVFRFLYNLDKFMPGTRG